MNYNDNEAFYGIYKIVLIGDSGVGKTNIVGRFTDDNFELETKSTIGVEFRSRTINVDDKIIKIQVWDTAGQERYRAITTAYYRGAHGVILVFDVTNKRSFDNLTKWMNEIHDHARCRNVIIIGNKTDLKHSRTISTEEGINYAKKHGCFYMETSALSCTNIMEAYEHIINVIIDEKVMNDKENESKWNAKDIPTIPILLDSPTTTKKKSCCN